MRHDYALTQAAAHGITVYLNVATQYDFDVGCLNGKSTAQLTAYGTALANRYHSTPNLIWAFGDDYYGYYDSQFNALLTGIRNTGDTRMVSIENLWESDSRFLLYDNTPQPWGTAHASFQHVYSYNAGYAGIEYAYAEANPLLVIRLDGHYDTDAGTSAERTFMRNLVWWCLSSGSRGFQHGREQILAVDGDVVEPPDDQRVRQLGPEAHLDTFAGLSGWHQLVPDLDSSLVTAGRGTKVSQIPAGGQTQYTGGNSYVSASVTPTGSLAVVYLPANRTITVNPAELQAGYTASWLTR